MPEIICTTVYQFPELSDTAKDKARSWYRQLGPHDDWWDAVYEDFERVCEILGIRLNTRAVRLMGGGAWAKPCIWFSGFCSQGDGASYEGYLCHAKGSAKRIRDYALQDAPLHGIADRLQAVQRRIRRGIVPDLRCRTLAVRPIAFVRRPVTLAPEPGEPDAGFLSCPATHQADGSGLQTNAEDFTDPLVNGGDKTGHAAAQKSYA